LAGILNPLKQHYIFAKKCNACLEINKYKKIILIKNQKNKEVSFGKIKIRQISLY